MQLVRELFQHPGLRGLSDRIRVRFEALIILANLEILEEWDRANLSPSKSELWTNYEKAIKTLNEGETSFEKRVIQEVESFGRYRANVLFLESVKRIELLSPNLIGNNNPEQQ